MKITTWNVNGLRAALNKGLLDWVEAHNPDVLCLQEIKARVDQIQTSDLKRLEAIFPYITWNSATRAGYSGVLTMAQFPPMETNQGINIPKFDGEGRVILYRYPDFHLFNIYFPNGQHDHARVPFKLEFYAHLLEQCDALHRKGEQVILTGDFNTAHQEIDLRNPKENQNTSGFLPQEREWIDRYLAHGFVDAYRTLYPERVQYTWWTYRLNARARNIGWRLDFFLVSNELLPRVKDVVIHEEVPGSDHCPVTIQLSPA